MTARIMTCIVQLHSPIKDEIKVASSQSDWRSLLKLWSVPCPLYHIASFYFVSKVNRLQVVIRFCIVCPASSYYANVGGTKILDKGDIKHILQGEKKHNNKQKETVKYQEKWFVIWTRLKLQPQVYTTNYQVYFCSLQLNIKYTDLLFELDWNYKQRYIQQIIGFTSVIKHPNK